MTRVTPRYAPPLASRARGRSAPGSGVGRRGRPLPVARPSPVSARRRAIRSAVAGWVSNQPWPPSLGSRTGFTIQRCCVPRFVPGIGSGRVELLERRDEPGRVAGDPDGGRVGEVLAVAAHGRLDGPRGERREQLEQPGETSSRPRDTSHIASAGDDARSMSSPPIDGCWAISRISLEEHVGQDHDGADQQRDDQPVPRVEVGDVGELVGDDALELLAVELLQQAAGDRDRPVRRVAADRRTRWATPSRSRRPRAPAGSRRAPAPRRRFGAAPPSSRVRLARLRQVEDEARRPRSTRRRGHRR